MRTPSLEAMLAAEANGGGKSTLPPPYRSGGDGASLNVTGSLRSRLGSANRTSEPRAAAGVLLSVDQCLASASAASSAQNAQRGGCHVFGRESEVLKHFLAGRGRAEALDADDHAFIARPAMPAERRSSLHRDARLDAFRQHAFSIRFVLRARTAPSSAC